MEGRILGGFGSFDAPENIHFMKVKKKMLVCIFFLPVYLFFSTEFREAKGGGAVRSKGWFLVGNLCGNLRIKLSIGNYERK